MNNPVASVEHKVRFGAFLREVTTQQRYLSYNALAPRIESEVERVAHRQAKLKLRSLDIYRLLQPYVSVRLRDQAKAVVPLALYFDNGRPRFAFVQLWPRDHDRRRFRLGVGIWGYHGRTGASQ